MITKNVFGSGKKIEDVMLCLFLSFNFWEIFIFVSFTVGYLLVIVFLNLRAVKNLRIFL